MKIRNLTLTSIIILSLLILPKTVLAKQTENEPVMCKKGSTYIVDIGDIQSEENFNLVGWGPIEPDSHGGSWGQIEGQTRVIWEELEDRTATVDFCLNMNDEITIRHLDGIADDSFTVRVNDIEIGQYVDETPYNDVETWKETVFPMTKEAFMGNRGEGHRQAITVEIEATGDPWAGFSTYGQVAIDWIEVGHRGK